MFEPGQKVMYLLDGNYIEAEMWCISTCNDDIVLNQYLDPNYKPISYSILYWNDVPQPCVLTGVKRHELFDKSEWLSNNRDKKIDGLLDE